MRMRTLAGGPHVSLQTLELLISILGDDQQN